MELNILTDDELATMGREVRAYALSCYPSAVKPNCADGRVIKGTFQDHWDTYVETVGKRRPELLAWEESLLPKVGPQGGTPDFQALSRGLDSYYPAPRAIDASTMRQVRNRLLRYFEIKKRTIPVQWQYAPAPRDTAASFPFFGKKTDAANMALYDEAQVAFPKTHWVKAQYRYQRRNWRNTFGDSVWNVGLVSSELATVRGWLRSVSPFFDSWRNPAHSLNARITHGLQSGFVWVETDQTKYDQHLTLELVEGIIFPVYYLLLPRINADYMAESVRQLYHAPVLWGRELRSGLHSSFSGMGFVTDFETILSFGIYLLAADRARLSAPFGAFNGDDSLVGCRTGADAETYLNAALGVCAELGLVTNPEKQRVHATHPVYLRRMYSASFPRDANQNVMGAYPVSFTLNGLFYPENGYGDPGMTLGAYLQVTDNLFGHPEWSNVASRICAKALRIQWAIAEGVIAKCPVDWWQRVYGESWDPNSSVTVKRLRAIHPEADSLLA